MLLVAGKASESWTQLLIDSLLLASRKDKVIIMSEECRDLSLLFYYYFSEFSLNTAWGNSRFTVSCWYGK